MPANGGYCKGECLFSRRDDQCAEGCGLVHFGSVCLKTTMPREWDAKEYERLANPMTRWGGQVLERLTLAGDETVLDAGCGTGRVTEQLLARLPRGRVIGIDASTAMIQQARVRFAGHPRVTLLVADLTTLMLSVPVNAILSTATFHWILDHEALFTCLGGLLRPGGQLVAQCGGVGNIDGVLAAIDEVIHQPRFAPVFVDWRSPWEYATPEVTRTRLAGAGFVAINTWLNAEPTSFSSPEHLTDYLQTVVLGTHLLRLTPEQQRPFAKAVADTVIARSGQALINYVRLNIVARRPE
jgi:trans-aconitate 2-methyltransferase